MQIYSSSTHQVNKSFAKFKENVFGGSFRHDGKLLVAGFESGTVKVLQILSIELRQCYIRKFFLLYGCS